MMDIRLEEHKSFVVCGYSVLTDLENGDRDVGKLWSGHKEELQGLSGKSSGLYGVMWYTDDTHKQYFYMLAVMIDHMEKDHAGSNIQRLEIPEGLYAVASLPDGADLGEAWTEFYFKELPARRLETDHQHGIFFEWYSANGGVELWNPVKHI
ncbi:MAG: GyrI-like domain-containing protein [Bacteroidales bacterium]|jgi:predicted transcriptional regulator YdeE|nr:GyrI-like domain-containing protein [Bacteroidales bacterium]